MDKQKRVGTQNQRPAENRKRRKKKNPNRVVWKDKKHWGPWAITFTWYTLTTERILIEKGLISKTYDEAYLFRMFDCRLQRGPLQRLFGTGTVTLIGTDATTPELVLKNIKNPLEVKEMISQMIIQQRKEHRIMEIAGHGRKLDFTDADGNGIPDFAEWN